MMAATAKPNVEPLAYRAVYTWRVIGLAVVGVLVFLRIALRASVRKLRVATPAYRATVIDFEGATMDGCTAASATHIRPSPIATSVAFLPDIPAYVTEIETDMRWRVPLPPRFREDRAEINGLRVAMTIGAHDDGHERAVLIIVPGMFNSRVQNVMIRTARTAFFSEGFDVVVPDLRGFGETGRIDPAPPSGTWKEGGDIAALAAWVRERLSSRAVFVCGFSYGASVALAAAADARHGVIDGCIAFSPFGDAKCLIDRLSTPPPALDPFAPF
jgi:alpha/beta superfamily hydrolase